jgi:hypothetical protein
MAASGEKLSICSGDMTGSDNPQSLVMPAPRTVTANFVAIPRFSVGLRTSGTLTKGEANATYAIVIADESLTATSGEVTVAETLPAGMSFVSMAGTGWTCEWRGHSCSRSDSLKGGASYPPITVTVNVAANAGAPLVNSVTVSGGGAATMTGMQLVEIEN